MLRTDASVLNQQIHPLDSIPGMCHLGPLKGQFVPLCQFLPGAPVGKSLVGGVSPGGAPHSSEEQEAWGCRWRLLWGPVMQVTPTVRGQEEGTARREALPARREVGKSPKGREGGSGFHSSSAQMSRHMAFTPMGAYRASTSGPGRRGTSPKLLQFCGNTPRGPVPRYAPPRVGSSWHAVNPRNE